MDRFTDDYDTLYAGCAWYDPQAALADAPDYYGAMLASPVDEDFFPELASHAAPMLGTGTPDRWGKSMRRHDKPDNADWRALQKRAARHFERAQWAHDASEALAR